MIKQSELLDISLKTDVSKLNEYINQQKELAYNPLIRLANEELESSIRKFVFCNYINEYIKVLNAYIEKKYDIKHGVNMYDRTDGLFLRFKGLYDAFFKIKKIASFYKSIQSFELAKDEILIKVNDYYTNLHNAKDYANDYLDKFEIKIKRYKSIDSDCISIVRKEFKHHINFNVIYKKCRILSDQLNYNEYPYWSKRHNYHESDIISNILYSLMQIDKQRNIYGMFDKNKKLSYKDAVLILDANDDDIILNKFITFFPQKAYDVFQARHVLNELSQK